LRLIFVVGQLRMNKITEIGKELRGQICWGITWDSQLNMSMSFGKPHLRIREPHATKSRSRHVQQLASHRIVTVKGAWWLWIFCAYWKLTASESLMVTNSSSLRQKQRAMAHLDGQKLKTLRVNAATGATEFTFDLGATLHVRRYSNDDSDIWTLYKPNGFVLGVRGDGTFTYSRGTTPPDRLIPRKIEMPNKTATADRQ